MARCAARNAGCAARNAAGNKQFTCELDLLYAANLSA